MKTSSTKFQLWSKSIKPHLNPSVWLTFPDPKYPKLKSLEAHPPLQQPNANNPSSGSQQSISKAWKLE